MPTSTDSPTTAEDVNLVARFLAHEQIASLHACEPVECLIICASAVLTQASHVFDALQARPSLAKALVLVGGIGHSTALIYEAVAQHPRFHTVKDQVTGLPEAQVLLRLLESFWDLEKVRSGGCRVLVEDRSTNCGANATETRKVLDEAGVADLRSCVVVQDPTMSLRTIASFDKAFDGLPQVQRPHFQACPVFVPSTRMRNGILEYATDGQTEVETEQLWEMDRFCELLVGEVTRLKDDETGYGPKGKGFIGHVDVPAEVENAARIIREVFGANR